MYDVCTMESKVDNIVKSYEEFIGADANIYVSPGAPNSVLDKNEGEVIDNDQYRTLVGNDQYRTLVGKIIFFATKVGPKISNEVRDLARHMQTLVNNIGWHLVELFDT